MDIKCRIKLAGKWRAAKIEIKRDPLWEIRGLVGLTNTEPMNFRNADKFDVVIDLELLGKYKTKVMFLSVITNLVVDLDGASLAGDFMSCDEIIPCDTHVISVLDEDRAVREIIVAKKLNRPIDLKGMKVPEWIQDLLRQELNSER